MTRIPSPIAPSDSIYERQLTILRLLRDATALGIVRWQQCETDEDRYFTDSGPIECDILFKWVAFHGDVGSDRDFVEIGLAGHHLAGTPGWWLVAEILAAGKVVGWDRHNREIAATYDKTIQRLTELMADSGN